MKYSEQTIYNQVLTSYKNYKKFSQEGLVKYVSEITGMKLGSVRLGFKNMICYLNGEDRDGSKKFASHYTEFQKEACDKFLLEHPNVSVNKLKYILGE
tara:strand:+ start:1160 stop:1453 length:294 start_codon:yes stop_codon:yes gene_type:complete